VSKRNKLSFNATAIYSKDDTKIPHRTTADARRGGIRDDFNLTPRFFVFGFADFESDAFQNLELRTVFGGGFGFHAIKTANATLDFCGGSSYARAGLGSLPPVPPATVGTPAETRNHGEAVFGESFNWKINGRTTVTEAYSIFPNTNQLGNYR